MSLATLHTELRKIADGQVPPAPPKSVQEPEKPKKPVSQNYKLPDADELPKDLQELRDQCIAWLQHQQHLRGRMREVAYAKRARPKQLYEIAAEIIDIANQLQSAYERLDYYTKHGRYLPGTAPFESLSEVEQLRHYLRVQPMHIHYVRKYSNSDKEHIQLEVAKRRAELAKIKDIANG